MCKLFISYSHKDESLVSKFMSHAAPLKNNNYIEDWYDRKIESGEEFQNDIDYALEKADIICLMISDNFLSSSACLKEKNEALELRQKKGIRVVPVILSPCSWLLHTELSILLAVPTDGKPVTSFQDQNEGWVVAIGSLIQVCSSVKKIRSLDNTQSFKEFLDSADILSRSHKNKELLALHDIFVYPKLNFYDEKEKLQKYDGKKFENEILKFGKIIIAGENQCGKTTLCKAVYKLFIKLGYVPVYLDDDNKYLGNPLVKVANAFKDQYADSSWEEMDLKRVVPIIDNFHQAKHQEKYITQFDSFSNQILIVDDIFEMNLKSRSLINEYNKFRIREFTALERNDLIMRWIKIKEQPQIQNNPNYLQQSLDEKTELIEHSLGVIFGKGIMPSYPFFILSVLAAQDIQKPLDSEITSQGHCYQALITLYLKKQGVKNDQIDIYSNFLTELSFFMFKNDGCGLDNDKFQEFSNYYKSKFNLPIPIQEILRVLSRVNICKFDSLNFFNFSYVYIYYFFVAKYLAENIEGQRKLIDKILANLHKDENAYIAIFIAHHTKSVYILDELLLNAEIQFENHSPATLDTSELSFFDEHVDKIIQAVLPSYNNPDEERQKLLEQKSNAEEDREDETDSDEDEGTMHQHQLEFLTNLRLGLKTAEVLGIIMKNRSGSLENSRLEYIYEQGLKVYLRILKLFIEIIKDKNAEGVIVNLLRQRLDQAIQSEIEDNLSIEKIEKLARSIFWNMNFGVLHTCLTKAIHGLGSSYLLNISGNVSKREDTPSAFIVNQGIRMWYGKNIRVDEIAARIAMQDFSKTAERLIKIKVIEHWRLHKISHGDSIKIKEKLKISSSDVGRD